MSFQPASGLANPHVQTILSSAGRRLLRPLIEDSATRALARDAASEIIEVEGVRLKVTLNIASGRPLVLLIPGWLGSCESSYVVSCATLLHNNGYSVARINLRDHGATAALNESMFNSAMIDEVVALARHLVDQYGTQSSGLIGYSLGGNFALRVAKECPELTTLAVCPALDPDLAMATIDRNFVYQRYFINKWRKTWVEKQAAFPGRYDFSDALNISTVSALTDYFVRHYCDFESTQAYFAAYDLTGETLKGTQAHILAATDDPIIPAVQYRKLPDSLTLELTAQGGHGAYLSNWRLESWADTYALNYFNSRLTATAS